MYLLLYFIFPIAGPILLGLIIALLGRRLSSVRLTHRNRTLAAVGAAIGLFSALERYILDLNAISALGFFSFDQVMLYRESSLRFTLPLIAGSIAVLLSAFSSKPNPGEVGASLTPRSTFTFTPRGLLISIGAAVTLSLVFAIAAGRTSTADEQGRYTMYWIDAGSQQSGTTIYGWHFSIPALVTLAVLLGLSAFSLWRTSMPALGTNIAAETSRRRLLSTLIAGSALAAILVQLSSVSQSLAGTASLSYSLGGGTAGVNGTIHGGTPFAALEPTLHWLDFGLGIAGIALWSYVFWRSSLGASRKVATATPSAMSERQ